MQNKRRIRPDRGFIFLFIIGGVLLFGLLVMLLWNAILPGVVHVSAITYPQALGILVLSKILFGGFGRRGGFGPGRRMQGRFAQMTPEEREQFKAEWRARCSRWGRKNDTTTTTAAAAE